MSTPNIRIGDGPIPLSPRTALIGACLLALTALAWTYLLHLSGEMHAMSEMGMAPRMQAWTAIDAAYAFAMWSVMMVGMMLPGASPVILLVARLPGSSLPRTLVFGLGYLAAWTGFSALATALQGGLQMLRLLGDAGLTQAVLGGAVLVAAGLYQWSAAKDRCLEHCRSPLAFLIPRWRPGITGAWRLGLSHGLYCIGCCWMLMLLLFVGGVMNLVWAAGLALLVLSEKLIPHGSRLARATGAGLVLWGIALLMGAP